MWERPGIACMALIFFWCEGCFWFGCLSYLCSVYTDIGRQCAGAAHRCSQEVGATTSHLSQEPQQQQPMPISGVEDDSGSSCPSLHPV